MDDKASNALKAVALTAVKNRFMVNLLSSPSDVQ